MKDKFLLILMDEEIILYKGLSKKIYFFKENTEQVRTEIEKFLSSTPNIALYLLIDRNHQELREEELPSLWLWDQWRLMYHKKQRCTSQGEVYGYHFFKQDKKNYLQWVSISRNDPLIDWLAWIKSIPNPFVGVYFVSLEAGIFLQKHGTSHDDYTMLIYTLSPPKTRHAIFKGRRLLLSRPFFGEEDLKSSLHFLGRTYPDIHEKIHVLNLNHRMSLKVSKDITSLDPELFIQFLMGQKPTTLSLKSTTSVHRVWFERSALMTFLLSLCLTGLFIYQGIDYQTAIQDEESKIALLKAQLENRMLLLKNTDIEKKRSSLAHYHHLQSKKQDPFLILKKLPPLLEQHHLKLENFIWDEGHAFEIRFSLPHHKNKDLPTLFQALLRSVHQAFPTHHVHVLEGPFKSSPHETYKYPVELPSPMVHIRLELP